MSMNPCGAAIRVGASPNPILLAWIFAQRRCVRSALARRGLAASLLAAFVVLGTLIAAVSWRLLRAHGAALLAPLHAHPLSVTVAAAAIGWGATTRSRRRVELQFAQGWLASSPVSQRDQYSAVRWRVGAELSLPFVAVLALIAGSGLASESVFTGLIAALVVGFATGALLGWRNGSKPTPGRVLALPRIRQSRAAVSCAASWVPLGRWPFAQLRAAANPHLEVRLLGALLLSLPMGIPPAIVLVLLAVAATVIAAVSLLRALLVMIPEAAEWLRSTPLDLGSFLRAACLRVLTWQVVFAGVGGALIVALGAATGAAFALCAGWLGICVTALASAIVCRHRPARLKIELIGIAAVLLAVGGVVPHALSLVLPALWVWQAARMRKA